MLPFQTPRSEQFTIVMAKKIQIIEEVECGRVEVYISVLDRKSVLKKFSTCSSVVECQEEVCTCEVDPECTFTLTLVGQGCEELSLDGVHVIRENEQGMSKLRALRRCFSCCPSF
mmetsp:Transcript_50108/g.144359  ORF Transcript_50108/g.144359 Transcript_50108/m.144359 type:complete len:115 (-) Transcript_50108:454-798(-)